TICLDQAGTGDKVKRRDFLVFSIGSIGMTVPLLARGQSRPCPVPQLSAGDEVVHTSCQKSALELTAATLAPGDHTTSLGDTGLSSGALYTIQWANRFYYDHAK